MALATDASNRRRTPRVGRADAAEALRMKLGVAARTLFLLLIVIAIGLVDYVTGPEIGFSLFYLAPIVAAAWYLGRNAAIVVACTAAACWFAADYLLRVSLPLSVWNGLTRLVIYTGQALLVSELRADRRREADLARTDLLTGLPNFRAFSEILSRVTRSGSKFAVMYIDLDNFKAVNDLFGHQAGDDVLKRVAQEIQRVLREDDVTARIGGDEFAAVLFDADAAACRIVATRLIEATAALGREFEGSGLGASIGAVFGSGDGVDTEGLIRAADEAMYRAKRRAKGTFEVGEV